VAGLLVAGCGASVLPAIHGAGDRLAVARQLMAGRDFTNAIELLRPYVDSGGGSADVDEAIYLLGECYLNTKEWAMASTELERLLRDYPESDSAPAGRFRLAEAWHGQSKSSDFDQEFTLKALEEWQRYLRDHPGHWLNAEADRRILTCRTRLADKLVKTGQWYLRLKLPEPARVSFEQVRAQYPDTSSMREAELGLALCDALSGRRAEAIERLKQVEARYPGDPVAERAARERRRLERS
jgi:outer membrane protein assembly factor BamD